MSLKRIRQSYKPFEYPWAYEAWLLQQQIHWIPTEVPMGEDVHDWATKLTTAEKNLLTQVFRFFTQADVEVNNCYMQHYSRVFKPTEVQMMLAAFSNMETVHIAAYSYLLDTLGMPESEYLAFLSFKEMKDKHEYMQIWRSETDADIARTLAVFGAFTEGLQLFASFAILMNFPRFNKLKGMGQIITWSIRDESLHTESIIRLYHTFLMENPHIDREALHRDLYEACRLIVEHEDAFIDLAFELGGVDGLASQDVKAYIRYVANHRLRQLHLEPLYDQKTQPLPWLEQLISGVEHTNFFENRATEYSRAATTGLWNQVFESYFEKNPPS